VNVLVTGASGLIGSALVPFLEGRGNHVRVLARSAPGERPDAWSPEHGWLDPACVRGVEAVIHLSGEPIASGRWTRAKKRAIRDSRVEGTRLLSSCLSRLDPPPRVLVSASAVGFYGDRGSEILDEEQGAGAGFLAETCRAWEEATAEAAGAGIRVVHVRIGPVLSDQGGLLRGLRRIFGAGLGGPVGNGQQYMSWVSILDVAAVIDSLLEDRPLAGAVNLVSPNPVTNEEFSRKLAAALHRPCILRTPAFAMTALLGELARELLLSSQRVAPARLLASGYGFTHPTIDAAFSAFLPAR
jgi:uncharacterized protein (TIGR01777 family)